MHISMFYTEYSTHVKAVEICHNSKIIKVPITRKFLLHDVKEYLKL